MIALSRGEIMAAVRGRLMAGAADQIVDRVVTDSREAGPGSLFVALRGEHADGHDHISGALDRGVTAVLSEREIPGDGVIVVTDTWAAILALAGEVRRRVDPKVIAITGSVGKTTTKDLCAAACSAQFETVASVKSFNNELGVPLTLLAMTESTQVLIAEVGSRGIGHIALLAPAIAPDVAIVTAVAAAHTSEFGDLDGVARAKGELVEALHPAGTAILNADDPRVLAMAPRSVGSVTTYGVSDLADVRATNIRLDGQARAQFDVRIGEEVLPVSLPLAGAHHVSNALAALASAVAVGVAPQTAAAAIAAAPISPMRSELLQAGGVTILSDAYNANLTSMSAALATLGALTASGTRFAVLGYMAELGDREVEDHRSAGALAAEHADRLIVVGDGLATLYVDGAIAAGMPSADIHQFADIEQASEMLCSELVSGDAVLVKASRVVGLERVADRVMRHLSPDPAGDAR